MGESTDRKKFPLVPPQESRCVWMTAGILSYQLCDREFDCEHCPLDRALRTGFTGRSLPDKDGNPVEREAGKKAGLRAGCLYGRNHVWVRALGNNSARVGVEPSFAAALVSPRAVVLPSIGERVHQGRVCAWIVIEGGTLPILAPLDGEVRSTNAALGGNPYAICEAPMGDGWLSDLSIDKESLERAGLLELQGAEEVYSADESRFQSLIVAELSKEGEMAGTTLADGGQPLQNVSSMLGAKKYFRLVRTVFT